MSEVQCIGISECGGPCDESYPVIREQTLVCEHEKVYSGECYATNPPEWFWICSKCLEQGRDQLIEKPKIAMMSYIVLIDKRKYIDKV